MSCETWREFGKPIKELVADYPAGLVSPKLYDLKAWRENENKKDDEASQKSQKDLEDWAIRSHEAEKQQQDKCWDQLEQRGYGDPDCYQSY